MSQLSEGYLGTKSVLCGLFWCTFTYASRNFYQTSQSSTLLVHYNCSQKSSSFHVMPCHIAQEQFWLTNLLVDPISHLLLTVCYRMKRSAIVYSFKNFTNTSPDASLSFTLITSQCVLYGHVTKTFSCSEVTNVQA